METLNQITEEMSVPDVLRKFPATRAVLDKYGLKGCGGPQGPAEPVRWFARLHGVPPDQLLRELNQAAKDAYAPLRS